MKNYDLDKKRGKRLADSMEYAQMNGVTLAQEVNKYYASHGLTATKTMSQQKISTIVTGRVSLKKEDAEIFARILNVKVEYLLLESDYMTEHEHIHAVAQSNVKEELACYTFMEALGYKFIDLKVNSDGSKESMNRRFKYLKINTDDTDEQILDKAHNAPAVRYYLIEDPEGRRAQINIDDMIRMQKAIRDYAVFQLEQSFKLIHQLEKWTKKKVPDTN